MRLVRDWRQSWRWFSVWAMAGQGAIASAWLVVPDDMRAAVPAEYLAATAIVLTIAGTIGRLVDQGGGDAEWS